MRRRFERQCRVLLAKVAHPSFENIMGNKVNLVDHEHELFCRIGCNAVLDVGTSAAHRIARVEDFEDDIRILRNLSQFFHGLL